MRNCKAEKNENEEVESGGSEEHVVCELRAVARATGPVCYGPVAEERKEEVQEEVDAAQEALAARPAGGEREAERRRGEQELRRFAQLPVVEEAHVPVICATSLPTSQATWRAPRTRTGTEHLRAEANRQQDHRQRRRIFPSLTSSSVRSIELFLACKKYTRVCSTVLIGVWSVR